MTGQINVNKIVARSGNLITYDSADVVDITLVKGENASSTNLNQGLAKIWIKIDGTQSAGSMPQDSFNVTSMTDTNTGRHIINYTNN